MGSYIQFHSEDGDILVEVDPSEVTIPGDPSGTGEQRAGIREYVGQRSSEIVGMARVGFEEAVRKAVRLNVPAFLAAAETLDPPPAEMEITFGLKGTGEVSNLAVGKLAGECNYQVRMVWKGNRND